MQKFSWRNKLEYENILNIDNCSLELRDQQSGAYHRDIVFLKTISSNLQGKASTTI